MDNESPAPALSIKEYSQLMPQMLGCFYDYVCEVAGLPASSTGWGLLHCVDPDGNHWTAVTDDIGYHSMLIALNETDAGLGDVAVPFHKYPVARRGWPDEWPTDLT